MAASKSPKNKIITDQKHTLSLAVHSLKKSEVVKPQKDFIEILKQESVTSGDFVDRNYIANAQNLNPLSGTKDMLPSFENQLTPYSDNRSEGSPSKERESWITAGSGKFRGRSSVLDDNRSEQEKMKDR